MELFLVEKRVAVKLEHNLNLESKRKLEDTLKKEGKLNRQCRLDLPNIVNMRKLDLRSNLKLLDTLNCPC